MKKQESSTPKNAKTLEHKKSVEPVKAKALAAKSTEATSKKKSSKGSIPVSSSSSSSTSSSSSSSKKRFTKSSKPSLNLDILHRTLVSYSASDTSFVYDDLHIDKTGTQNKSAPMKKSPKLDQLIQSLDEIEIIKSLVHGQLSVVHKARHTPTGKIVAIKELNVFEKGNRQLILKEVTALYDSSCEHLVSFYGAFYNEGSIYIAMEFMALGSLRDVLPHLGFIPEFVLAALARQVLLALFYLHKKTHRMHRDIKPSNIVLTADGRAKLTDFGLSTKLQNTIGVAKSFVGTCTYMSPERISGIAYSYSSDIWSFGLCLLECVLGKYPYPQTRVYFDLIESIVNDEVPFMPVTTYSESIRSFVYNCLHKRPRSRSTCQQLLSHPFTDISDKEMAEAGQWIKNKMAQVKSKESRSEES